MKGSTWHRWDLHYHTHSSYDHHNKSKTNQEIVDELLADNVSAVVISDHHRIDFSRINELNKIANGQFTESTLLPKLQEQLKQKEKEIENIVNAVQKGFAADTLLKRLSKLEKEKNEIENSIAKE